MSQAVGEPSESQLCACGSGLTRTRCCEMNLASLGAREASRHLAPLEERAAEAQRSGATEEAERLALDVLELAPGRTRALTVLFEIRKAQTKPDASAALIRRIVALEPNNFWATNELTLLLLGRGNVHDAERHARNAVRMAPENAQSHYLMGMVLTEAHRPAVGEYHYQRALELSGARDPVLLDYVVLQRDFIYQSVPATFVNGAHMGNTRVGFGDEDVNRIYNLMAYGDRGRPTTVDFARYEIWDYFPLMRRHRIHSSYTAPTFKLL